MLTMSSSDYKNCFLATFLFFGDIVPLHKYEDYCGRLVSVTRNKPESQIMHEGYAKTL